ncbi:MAG TPA: polysaccharide deacetylase family protein [Rubrobacteraceae bacterium]|nr:polysaccharide deacetylase family protein [Rubrobacteraceae bacterium]
MKPAGLHPVHLTFDDGPDPLWTRRTLDALRDADARATFFVVAPLARQNPALVAEMIDGGHRVELHCAEHARHTERSRAEIVADTESALADLHAIGARPRLWRPPWGVTAPWTTTIAERFGLELALWTIDPHDWRGDSPREMLAHIEPRLRPGAVVLLHDGLGPGARRTGCGETAALIPALVHSIRARGLEPAPMTDPVAETPVLQRTPA